MTLISFYYIPSHEPPFQATMGDKSVETLCHFRLLKANFFPNLYNTTPSPLSMLDFLSLEFASFLYNIEKGAGGLALNINRI